MPIYPRNDVHQTSHEFCVCFHRQLRKLWIRLAATMDHPQWTRGHGIAGCDGEEESRERILEILGNSKIKNANIKNDKINFKPILRKLESNNFL